MVCHRPDGLEVAEEQERAVGHVCHRPDGLEEWENRINLELISIDILDQGKFILDLKVVVVDSNQNESLSIPLNFGAIS